MNYFVQAMVNGVAIGGLYGLFALSVVVLFRTSGTINFAQGNMSMFFAFITFFLFRDSHLSLPLACTLGVLIGGAGGLLTYGLVIRPYRGSDPLNSVFRTLAVMLLLFAVAQRAWGAYQPYTFPSLFGDGGFVAGGFRVLWLQVGAFSVAIALALLFAAFLNRPGWGLMIRAVASDRIIASLIGVRVNTVEMLSWMVAGALAAAIGILFAPFYSLSADMMGAFLLKGFTAALLGGLTSFRGAIIAGLLVGVVDSVVGLYSPPEVQALAAFLLMLGVLALRPAGLFGRIQIVRM